MNHQKSHSINKEVKVSESLKYKEFEIAELIKKNHRFKRFNNDLLGLIRKHGIRMKIQELTMDENAMKEEFSDTNEGFPFTPDSQIRVV